MLEIRKMPLGSVLAFPLQAVDMRNTLPSVTAVGGSLPTGPRGAGFRARYPQTLEPAGLAFQVAAVTGGYILLFHL